MKEMNKEIITVEELMFIRCFVDAYTYIARNADGRLNLFYEEPKADKTKWYLDSTECEDIDFGIEIDDDLFGFISWNSKTAWSIAELMKLEVEK